MQKNSKQLAVVAGINETLEFMNPKLLQVLKKLLEPTFKLQNQDYLNLLATYLTNENDKLTPHQIEVTKQYLEAWVKECVIEFEKSKDPPTKALLTFVLNVTQYICKTEQIFIRLNSEEVLERLIKIIKDIYQPNVTTTFIKLLSNFLDHKSGVQWMISTNYWKHVINIILNDATIYAYKEGYTFVTKLLQKSIILNESFCKIIISHILSPFYEILRTISTREITETQNKNLLSTLRLISEILMMLIQSEYTANENAVISMCTEDFELEKGTKELISVTNNPELKCGLYQIIIFLGLHNLKLKLSGKKDSCNIKTDIPSAILDILYEAASVVSVSGMLQLLYSTLNCWNSIKKSLPESVRHSISFEDQLLAIQLMPMYTIFVKTIGFNVYTSDCEDSFRYIFISKLVDRIYPRTIRVKYKWQNHLLDNYSISNGILSLKYFIHSKQFYSKENAILIFQMLVYLIEDLTTTLKEKPELQLQFVNEPDYLDLHLKLISLMIEEFKLTTHDSIESLCVLYIMYRLLDGFIWPSKIVVTALKLVETGISKYNNFEISILIDNREGTLMPEFTALLRVKLHDGAWEVRDSAIELLQSLFVSVNTSECTTSKKILLENNIPSSILNMGIHDGNPFVRASALRCTQKTIVIPEFWDEFTRSCDIYTTVLKALKSETEGIVRYEAAALVDCIYQHHQIPENIENDFFDAMSHAVVADLHWEVRVKALPFWKKIIDDSLAYYGFIDGSFPNVTFSKDLKKIVTLSSVEIKKCLVKVLYKLSELGCLFVFYEALQDECDIEVSKCAAETIKEFVNLLKKHDVTVETLQLYTPSTSFVTSSGVSSITDSSDFTPISDSLLPHDSFMTQTTDNIESMFINNQISDAILEDILDTRDLNLLETVFNAADLPVFENIETKKRKVLQPELFLNLVYTDLERRVSVKTTWVEQINDFQSLLDDILKEYEFDDVNSMDCY